ncbi:glycosyltransferase family 2 protein [Pseudooceanicola sp. MF1-13]|uniref:glycosyltransferase family 2 protein n=1 Tax=Pseudooceanicola sp. MF1-13 TaxID=3379095 RepID=UPI0038913E9D
MSTVKGDTTAIARFVAWHLELGAESVSLYFDAPDAAQIEALRHPRVKLVACDDAHWDRRRFRPEQHQLRQVRNATEEWRNTRHEWLAHIDMDEFLLPPKSMTDILADIPNDCAALRVPPVEQLAGGEGRLFKRTATDAGLKKAALREVYPNFGHYLRGGFLSHLEGKILLRAGGQPRAEKVRLGIHMAFWHGERISNRITLPDLPLGHAHAPDWETFERHLAFRRSKGSYRNKIGERFLLAELLDFLEAEEGEDGFRMLFSEVAEATPSLIEKLGKRNMLLEYPLDLEGPLSRWYPELLR